MCSNCRYKYRDKHLTHLTAVLGVCRDQHPLPETHQAATQLVLLPVALVTRCVDLHGHGLPGRVCVALHPGEVNTRAKYNYEERGTCVLQWSGTNPLPHFSPDISELFIFIHLVTFSHQLASKSCPHVTVRNVKCPCKCHKGIWCCGCVAPLILHSCTRWRSVMSLMFRPIHP